MRKPGIKTILISVTVFIILLLIIIIRPCSKSGDRVYIFEKITTGEVKKTISVTGELNIQEQIILVSKITGVIEKIFSNVNENVSRGQLLIKIDSTGIDQRIQKIQSSLETSKYEILAASRDYEGKKNLFKDNLISKSAMEQAEIQYKSVQTKYNQIKIDYDIVLMEKQNTKIYAPVNGIILSQHVTQNAAVAVATPLIMMTPSLKNMILTINIDESDIGNVKHGQNVVFSVSAFPNKIFKGVINQVLINPVKIGALVSYQATVLCDNDELLLKPGMTATATVVIDQKNNVLRVPNQAFIITPDDTSSDLGGKYLSKKTGAISSKQYSRIEVKQGLVGDMYTEIISGLKDGDEVLVKIQEPK